MHRSLPALFSARRQTSVNSKSLEKLDKCVFFAIIQVGPVQVPLIAIPRHGSFIVEEISAGAFGISGTHSCEETYVLSIIHGIPGTKFFRAICRAFQQITQCRHRTIM